MRNGQPLLVESALDIGSSRAAYFNLVRADLLNDGLSSLANIRIGLKALLRRAIVARMNSRWSMIVGIAIVIAYEYLGEK